MRSFRHLTIFSLIYLPMLFASQVIGQTFSININLYGLYFMAAVCGLRRTEAVIATIVSGFWMDVLQTECLFGLSALLLSALTFACHKQSWRVVLEAHARILSVCAQCFLQGIYLLCAFTVTHTPMHYVRFYLGSFLISAVLTAIVTPSLLRFQKKFFV
jgi:rod shape-determining protein MreD